MYYTGHSYRHVFHVIIMMEKGNLIVQIDKKNKEDKMKRRSTLVRCEPPEYLVKTNSKSRPVPKNPKGTFGLTQFSNQLRVKESIGNIWHPGCTLDLGPAQILVQLLKRKFIQLRKKNKPGTSQVGAIPTAQKARSL